jgi:hypothetical protein
VEGAAGGERKRVYGPHGEPTGHSRYDEKAVNDEGRPRGRLVHWSAVRGCGPARARAGEPNRQPGRGEACPEGRCRVRKSRPTTSARRVSRARQSRGSRRPGGSYGPSDCGRCRSPPNRAFHHPDAWSTRLPGRARPGPWSVASAARFRPRYLQALGHSLTLVNDFLVDLPRFFSVSLSGRTTVYTILFTPSFVFHHFLLIDGLSTSVLKKGHPSAGRPRSRSALDE